MKNKNNRHLCCTNVSDSFAEYYIKCIDEKQDRLEDKQDKLNEKQDSIILTFSNLKTKIENLPTKDNVKNIIKDELEHYATSTDIAQNTNRLIGIMTGIIAVALTIFGLIK